MSNNPDPLEVTGLWKQTSPTQAGSPPSPLDVDRTAQAGPPSARAPHPSADPAPLPARIGRYRVDGLLGVGGFGRVYRAFDDQLGRAVAIKVPDDRWLNRPSAKDLYLNEARLLAQLDHPHIVPVYDVGSDGGSCFIVSRLIEGSDLARRLRQPRMPVPEAAELVATIARALHHAHVLGVIHRDIKPSNILLDQEGQPYLADFGLAIDETMFGRGPMLAGTPAYMSPEQARGEGHRVDGRSDIFSLGVVFYEMLTGRRPFRAESQEQLLEEIVAQEPRPPRQIDDHIPRELERICLKALAKRVAERYTTASDLADDLHDAWSKAAPPVSIDSSARSAASPPHSTHSTRGGDLAAAEHDPLRSQRSQRTGAQPSVTIGNPRTEANELANQAQVVPKGLRSFDAGDADFFLDLLPGARDRDGLPPSIRFWKTRLESTDAEHAFSVGLVYGPSGCGKSSLIKAGLIPRLRGHVEAAYFEATPEGTETRLLQALRRARPGLPELDLVETCARIRRHEHESEPGKLVLFIDQFEQWLHAHRAEEDTQLARALRQCDGVRLQCVLLVRDDFWMAVTRLMRELEVRLVEGENSAAVDLFGPRHARRVLAAFGRAFGCLAPDCDEEGAGEQAEFVRRAVAGLTDQGTVIPVRLALLADMMKGKPWTPASLEAMGGAAGIGATFLHETFTAATAPPSHRFHQRAARRVLKTLLYVPGQATSIKGRMRSRSDLMDACDYHRRPEEFSDLLAILDNELRLITPTEPVQEEYVDGGAVVAPPTEAATRLADGTAQYYQLTHDYLVPALRDWLTRQQRETRRGRAELRLEEHAELWNSRPIPSHLPAWWEVGSILLLTRRKFWTPEQRRMMRAAVSRHAVQAAVVAAVLVVLAVIGWEVNGRYRAAELTDRVVQVETSRVPQILKELAPYRRWSNPLLTVARDRDEPNSPPWINSTLALLDSYPELAETLVEPSLRAEPEDFAVLRDILGKHRQGVVPRLWSVLESAAEDASRRIAAAMLLARFVPEDDPQADDLQGQRWSKSAPFLAALLVDTAVNETSRYQRLQDELAPAGRQLVPALRHIYLDRGRDAARRAIALNLAETYAAGDLKAQVEVLIATEDAERFTKRVEALAPRQSAALDLLREKLVQQPAAELIPRWNDPADDPSWLPASPSVARRIEAAGGLVTDRFALCQTAPLAEFAALAEALRPAGYRPIRLRPYRVESESEAALVRVAAVWTRDERDWRVATGLSEDDVQSQLKQWGDDLVYAADLAGYLDGEFRYALVAEKNPDLAGAEVRIGLIEQKVQAAFAPLANSPYHFVALQGALDESNILRYCWTLQQNKGEHPESWFGLIGLSPVSEQSFQRQLDREVLPMTDLHVTRLPPPTAVDTLLSEHLAVIEKRLDGSPGDVNAVLERGIVQDLLGQYDQALNDFEFVLSKQPTQLVALERRAIARARAGQVDAARQDLATLTQRVATPFEKARVTAAVAVLLGGHEPAFAEVEARAKHLQASGATPAALVPTYASAARTLAQSEPQASQTYARRAVEWFDTLNYDLIQVQRQWPMANLLRLPAFQEHLRANPSGYGYVVINGSSGQRESRTVYGLAPAEMAAECRELSAAGWRPVAISVTQPRAGAKLVSAAVWQRPVVDAEDLDEFARGRARAAVAALRWGADQLAWDGIRQATDVRVRDFLVDALPRYGVDPRKLVARLEVETDAATRQILLAALGGYSTESFSAAERAEIVPQLLETYRREGDAGVHSSVDWLLRKWGQADELQQLDQNLANETRTADRHWLVDGQGHSLTVVSGPVEFRMGSPAWEPGKSFSERQHPRRIGRSFAVATREVTVEQFQRFLADYPAVRNDAPRSSTVDAELLRRPALASWWEAAQYCRWLSEQEGIPEDQMCYPPVAEIKAGMKLGTVFDRTGYRLPSEAEWEYMARAGAETTYSFGSSAQALERYAWYKKNSNNHLWPVGQLLPNRLGLYDQCGNALEWCHNVYVTHYPSVPRGPVNDIASPGTVTTNPRVQRGGWFGSEPQHVRSAVRWSTSPNNRNSADGFRVARTLAEHEP